MAWSAAGSCLPLLHELCVARGGSGYRSAGFWAALGHSGNATGRFGNGLGRSRECWDALGALCKGSGVAFGTIRGAQVRSGELWRRSGDAQEAAWNAQKHVKCDVVV